MTQQDTTVRFAQAVLRLGGNPDWEYVRAHIEALYESLKDALVVSAGPDTSRLQGEALALRRLINAMDNARETLDRVEASRQGSKTQAIP